jgi:type VI secretion system protein ImpL
MTRKLKVALGGTAFVALFSAGTWFSGDAFALQGRDLWLYRGGLILLGLIATIAVAWFILRRPEKPAAAPTDDGREIDAAVATAKTRLASARQTSGSGLYKLPLFLVLGPEGSTKTTAVIRSGLEPELLAGEVFRGETVAPTRSVNLWYSQQAILVEASGRVTTDSSRWMRLVRQLHPRRLRAALSRGSGAPRVAVVCISCEEFIRPNSPESVPAAARMLRGRLSDLAEELGTNVPVYVLFTKSDRLPHFAEYVRSFSRDEAQDVLGTTLPLEGSRDDSYAERAFKRIESRLQELFHSLASKRLKFLPRENDPQNAGSAYEFPREFRKLIPLATEFLVELCRPSQLAVNPILRGFYFVGVRPVIVTNAAFEAVPQAAETRDAIRIGATHVFNPGQGPAAAVAAKLAEPSASSRKVPQWVFLERLFPQIFLADQVALAMTRGRKRVHVLRRLLLAGIIVASAVVAAGFFMSYVGNLRLQESLEQSRQSLAGFTPGTVPSEQALRELEQLRSNVEMLGSYERNGPPWHLRLGLYSGSALYPTLRRNYWDSFGRMLLAPTRDSLLRELRGLPDAPQPGSDYGNTYEALKAYLIITARPDQSTTTFLSPALFDHWRGAKGASAAQAQLAKKQFDFYAAALPSGNPFRSPTDSATVKRTRAFLSQFAGTERIYRSVLAQALGSLPAVDFGKRFPGAAGIVSDPHVVPGAYTREGWAALRNALKDIDRFFKGEAWVVGEQGTAVPDRKKVLDQIRTMYTKEYVNEWRTFLNSATVDRFGSLSEGARRLGPLSGNQSPLLAMFSLVSRNTALDSLPVGAAFQPVQVVTPPGDTAKYIGPSNEAYINALVSLQASLDQLTKGPSGGGDGAVGQALSDAAQARLAAKQIANKFQVDEVGKVHIVVQKLMEAPIQYAEASLQSFGPAQLNGKGRAFCAPFQQLMAKYPFNPSGETGATMDEVSSLLQPGTGALWTFAENDLGNYLVKQGSHFAEKPGGTMGISPGFIDFLNRAADFSSTLWSSEGAPPGLTFTLRPLLSDSISSLTVTLDGQPARFTRTSTGTKRLSWKAGEGQEANLSGQILGQEQEVFAFQGPWAIFKLFQRADWSSGQGSYTIEWPIPNQELKARFVINLAGAKPILQRDFFAGVSCTGRITR